MTVKSKVITNARWEIKREILSIGGSRALKHDKKIVSVETDFIANYNPVIYCNDLSGQEWCFDTKLPTGGWLENIRTTINKDGTRVFKAVILC